MPSPTRSPGRVLSRIVAALPLALAVACGSGESRPDVVLVSLDTLRADGLSCYGNPAPTSPAIDGFAASAVRFEECLAQAPNTATSHASLFTGLHPFTHRVANLTSFEEGTPGLPDAFETLAERLESVGYETIAITDGGPLGSTWNLMQGFDRLEGSFEGVRAKVDRVLELLAERESDAPLFLFLHTYQVHLPYVAPEAFVERFAGDYDGPLVRAVEAVRAQRRGGGEAQPDGKLLLAERDTFTDADWAQLRRLYDAEVAYTDSQLARVLELAEPDGPLAEACIAITSDHGEEFGEHGRWGHYQLHRETLRVPLVLRLPGGVGRGRVVAEPVGLIDLFATLLDVARVPPPEVVDARSLLPLVRGERWAEQPLFAGTTEHLYASDRDLPWRRSVRSAGHALLSTRTAPDDPSSEVRALYDLAADPGEARDLAGDPAGAGPSATRRLEHLASELELHLARAAERRAAVGRIELERRPASEELRRELEALGYAGY